MAERSRASSPGMTRARTARPPTAAAPISGLPWVSATTRRPSQPFAPVTRTRSPVEAMGLLDVDQDAEHQDEDGEDRDQAGILKHQVGRRRALAFDEDELKVAQQAEGDGNRR